jgi:exodeoxyribonuclease VII large subunit
MDFVAEPLTLSRKTNQREVFTVSQLTRLVKDLLENLPALWVQGEISNFKRHSSGHMYFVMKDEQAQIPCVMWAGRNQSLTFAPQDGMEVLAHGRITVYEKRGNYQLDVWQMQLAGIGALQQAFEQLKQRLAAEGLFDAAHKKPLPKFPSTIGLVTSPTGAAIRDLISVLKRRWPAIEIILTPVRVQGEGAAEEIAEAIRNFDEYGGVDLLIVGRGGGSLEDLWAFNEEIVARAIYASKVPIISAVGHEIDFSISDFVADVRAATPSAAAELAVPDRDEVYRRVVMATQRVRIHLQGLAQSYRERLRRVQSSYGFRQPLDLVRQRSQLLDELSRRMEAAMKNRVAFLKRDLESLHHRLQALSHENILRRGFSLVFRERDGKLIRDAADLKKDEQVKMQFAVGSAEARIEEIDIE